MAFCMMPPSSDSDALSVVMASGGESVGSRLGVATSRSNGSVVSMVVGSSDESIVTDVAVSGSRASVLDLASDSDSDVGETASGGLHRPGQVLEVVSRGPPRQSQVLGGGYIWRISPMCRRPADLKLNLELKWRFRMASFGIVCAAGFARCRRQGLHASW